MRSWARRFRGSLGVSGIKGEGDAVAITSKGYAGTIDDVDWSVVGKRLGVTYAVFGEDAFNLTQGPGDRQVVIGPGHATGHGVIDRSDSDVTLSAGVVATGSRWDMVVLRRNWSSKVTSLAIVAGSASKALPAREMRELPDGTVATLDEQPLWLVRFDAGQTAVQEVVDLRAWYANGGLTASDPMVRDYLTDLGTSIRIGGAEWNRTLVGGIPAWVDFGQHDRIMLPSGVPGALRLGVDTDGRAFLRADGDVLYGRRLTEVVPATGNRLLVVSPLGLVGALPERLPISAGGTEAGTAPEAARNLGIYAGDFSGETLTAGQSRVYRIPVPGDPSLWIPHYTLSSSDLKADWARGGGEVTIRVTNPTSGSRTFSLGWTAIRRNTLNSGPAIQPPSL